MPSPPSSYEKPDVPFCLSTFSYTNEHTCESWEIDSYVGDVEKYVEKMRDYASEAVNHANKMREYALSAQAYASCEIEDVVSQHE